MRHSDAAETPSLARQNTVTETNRIPNTTQTASKDTLTLHTIKQVHNTIPENKCTQSNICRLYTKPDRNINCNTGDQQQTTGSIESVVPPQVQILCLNQVNDKTEKIDFDFLTSTGRPNIKERKIHSYISIFQNMMPQQPQWSCDNQTK